MNTHLLSVLYLVAILLLLSNQLITNKYLTHMKTTETIKTSYTPKYQEITFRFDEPTIEQKISFRALLVCAYVTLQLCEKIQGTKADQRELKHALRKLCDAVNNPQLARRISAYTEEEPDVFIHLVDRFENMFKVLGTHTSEETLQLLEAAIGLIVEDKDLFAEKIGIVRASTEQLSDAKKREKVREKINKIELPQDYYLLQLVNHTIDNYYYQKESKFKQLQIK